MPMHRSMGMSRRECERMMGNMGSRRKSGGRKKSTKKRSRGKRKKKM